MDVQMPVRNGYKATKVIRGLNRPDAKTVIIYACTANTFREDQERARNVGMDGFIAKPIDVSKLMQKLRAGTGITDSYEVLNQAGEEFAAQYTDYDVTVEVVKFAYTEEDEYITGCFDTDHAVDVLFEGYFNMAGYIHTGRVVPLDDIITEELRADVDDMLWKMSQMDGKTYMLPYYSLQNTLIYNKNLFRQCGLAEYIGEEGTIQSWTPEEWEDILATLAEKLPEMTYPMLMYAKNDQGDTHIMTLLRSKGSPFFNENGRFNLNTKEGIAALQWIADSYQKGYFPAGCENMEIIDCSNLFTNNQLAIKEVWQGQ